jgi:ribosomal protein S18 acetylase RimI-like enzyme
MSLLVTNDNAPALRLYDQAGFVDRGVFAALGVAWNEEFSPCD